MLDPVDLSTVPFDPTGILSVLAEHDVDFVVIGGLAALVHGYDRATVYVDATTRNETENLSRLTSALSALDARLLVPVNDDQDATIDLRIDSSMFQAMTSVRFLTRIGVLDIVLRPDGAASYDDWVRESSGVDLRDGGPSIRFASLRMIIDSKRAANRPKDLEALPRLETLQRLRDLRGLG